MAMQTLRRPGWTFCPADQELTDVYLPRELAGNPVPVTLGYVHHVDIYSADPEHLVEKLAHALGTGKADKSSPVWYFLSPVRSAGGRRTAGGRKARMVVGGTWHAESTKAVKGSTLGGFVKTFSYVKKCSSGKGRERLGWIMKEYDISPQNGGGGRVLCKIYRTPRDISTPSSSTTTTSSSVSDSGVSKKRKAAGDHPDAPIPSARRTDEQDNFVENLEHVSVEDCGESEHYNAAAYFYGTATHLPGGETMELPPCPQESFNGAMDMQLLPCVQDNFLPSSEFYGTAHMQGGDLEVPPSMELSPSVQDSFLPSSEFYGTAHMQGGDLEVSRSMELPPCPQESFLPSSEFNGPMPDFYWTELVNGDDIDLDELLRDCRLPAYQPSEEETIEEMIRELS